MAIYDYDGMVTSEVGAIYDNDGTTNYLICDSSNGNLLNLIQLAEGTTLSIPAGYNTILVSASLLLRHVNEASMTCNSANGTVETLYSSNERIYPLSDNDSQAAGVLRHYVWRITDVADGTTVTFTTSYQYRNHIHAVAFGLE